MIENTRTAKSCDIFCAVVDNYGDIGVCWRLARQLANEHGLSVRLWVDDLRSFGKLCPELDVELDEQRCRGVEVVRWTEDAFRSRTLSRPVGHPLPQAGEGERAVADLVIEAFACKLPQSYIEAMAAREPKPVWLNLEYLSAEDWVEGCHKLPSPHPSLPLTKYFFFPGFTGKTGGLLLERDLLARRDAFQSDVGAQARYWRGLGVPERIEGELRVSLFGYENEALEALLGAWERGNQLVTCLVPEGRSLPQVEAFFGQGVESGIQEPVRAEPVEAGSAISSSFDVTSDLPASGLSRMAITNDLAVVVGQPSQMASSHTSSSTRLRTNGDAVWQRGNLRVHVLPFVAQERYDELLWACDVNFVRGEDSCVRAQWAGKPFIWQIYPQHDGVHLEKLEALLVRYTAGLPPEAVQTVRDLWLAWNGGQNIPEAWKRFALQHETLTRHGAVWAQRLAGNNIALNLLDFFRNVN